MSSLKRVGAYIHIPFCQKKCYYCDFAAFPNLESWIKPYVDNLIREIKIYKERMDLIIDTVYIGGGTPTYIDESYIEAIVNELRNFRTDIKEFTIEANPKSLDENKLKTYKRIGINRISLGVQTFDDEILKKIGRNHSKDIALRDIDLIRKLGFTNLSLDLMLNLPGQDISKVKKDLDYVEKILPEHLSWYSLILDKGSRFYAQNKNGELELMDSDLEMDIFSQIIERLKKLGLNRYEVSNFAKDGYESIHNRKYWNEEGYLGLGIAAAGFLSNIRYTNIRNLAIYDKDINNNRLPIASREFVSKKEFEKEYIIFKLREVSGINLKEFKDRFGFDFLEKYKHILKKFEKNGFFKIGDNISFTVKGFDLSNEFFIEII